MTEQERPTSEKNEVLKGHMVNIDFDLPGRGVDYRALVGLSTTLEEFRSEFGEALGVTHVGAHIDLPDEVLRVVAHIDGFVSEVEEVVGYVARIVEDCDVIVPLDSPSYTTRITTLPAAS